MADLYARIVLRLIGPALELRDRPPSPTSAIADLYEVFAQVIREAPLREVGPLAALAPQNQQSPVSQVPPCLAASANPGEPVTSPAFGPDMSAPTLCSGACGKGRES